MMSMSSKSVDSYVSCLPDDILLELPDVDSIESSFSL